MMVSTKGIPRKRKNSKPESGDDTEALIRRQRKRSDSEDSDHVERWKPPPGTWNDDLPYGGKVYLARKKKPDPLWMKVLEVHFSFDLLLQWRSKDICIN